MELIITALICIQTDTKINVKSHHQTILQKHTSDKGMDLSHSAISIHRRGLKAGRPPYVNSSTLLRRHMKQNR